MVRGARGIAEGAKFAAVLSRLCEAALLLATPPSSTTDQAEAQRAAAQIVEELLMDPAVCTTALTLSVRLLATEVSAATLTQLADFYRQVQECAGEVGGAGVITEALFDAAEGPDDPLGAFLSLAALASEGRYQDVDALAPLVVRDSLGWPRVLASALSYVAEHISSDEVLRDRDEHFGLSTAGEL